MVQKNAQIMQLDLRCTKIFMKMRLNTYLYATKNRLIIIPAKNLVIKYYPHGIQRLVEVTCDVHLIRMFSLFQKEKEIDLSITNSEVPSSVVESYHKLKADKEQKG